MPRIPAEPIIPELEEEEEYSVEQVIDKRVGRNGKVEYFFFYILKIQIFKPLYFKIFVKF